jgi:hypothetical protein
MSHQEKRDRRTGLGLMTIMAVIGVALALATSPVRAQGLTEMWNNPDGQLGSLAPENLKKHKGDAPVDLTGTYMINGEWRFLPLPDLKPRAQKLYELSKKYEKEGKTFNNAVGRCWPPGMPIMMTRVWPIHIIQLPTAVVIISNFENQVRWIYTDGRDHTDPDIVVPTYNGESIGHWEGEELVVHTKHFDAKNHFVDNSIPVSEDLEIIERFRKTEDGLEIKYTMTDPQNWEGEWVSTKQYKQLDKVDFKEVHCLPDTNEGIPCTHEKYNVTTEEALEEAENE